MWIYEQEVIVGTAVVEESRIVAAPTNPPAPLWFVVFGS